MREARRGNPAGLLRRYASRNDSLFTKGRWYHFTGEKSVGAGEATHGPVAAAIGNAVFDALGVRVRSMPLTAEAITKAALAD